MAGFKYGPWLPDIDDLNATTSPVASGCLPTSRGWGPWPSLSIISAAVGGTVRGAFMARTSNGSAVPFVATATKLYKYSSLSAWTDVSRLAGGAYALPTDEYWSMDQQDNKLYAVQGGDVPQVIDIDAGANFAALGGSPPTARYVKSVGGFLFLMDLTAATGPIRPTTGRIQFAWSAYRDPAYWTYGQRSSDVGTLPAGGFIRGMTAPETGLMIQQSAVNRFVRVNDRRVWDFATIEGGQGTNSPYSIIEHQGVAYYYGTDGFVASNAGSFSAETGIEAVDEWFKANVNLSRLGTIIGALDPTRPRLMWLFPTEGNETYTLDHIIGFDVKLQRWFHGEVDATYIFKAATPGVTLEGLGSAGLGYTLETIPFSLDSPIWQGGAPQVGGFDAAQKMGFFSGYPMEASLRTGRLELIPGLRAYVNGWRPQTDASTATGRIGVAESPQGTIDFSGSAAINSWGVIEQNVSGRVMQFETTIPAAATWTSILGGDFDDDMVKPDGRA